jgi:hypothetical protein
VLKFANFLITEDYLTALGLHDNRDKSDRELNGVSLTDPDFSFRDEKSRQIDLIRLLVAHFFPFDLIMDQSHLEVTVLRTAIRKYVRHIQFYLLLLIQL